MFLSNYLIPTLLDNPRDALVVSHKLMLRSGLIRQASSGIYHWLPSGVVVLQKIIDIVRKNMDAAGALQIIIPIMQSVDLWKKSNRHGDSLEIGRESFIIRDRNDQEFLLSPTAEEIVTKLFQDNIRSSSDLPKNLYQIHWKFRNEMRPRYGVLRCREFLMKDAYSFDVNYAKALESYERMLKAYMQICTDIGIKIVPVLADSGVMGGDYTHEIHVLSQDGESTIYYDEEIEKCSNSDFTLDVLNKLYTREFAKHDIKKAKGVKIKESKGIEVGQLFMLGDHYTKIFNAKLQHKDEVIYPYMGCYGIGISRLVGAVIEANHDDKGIIWPKNITPFKVGIISKALNGEASTAVLRLYDLLARHFGESEILYDDRDVSMGNKYNNMDLIGIPLLIAVKYLDDANGNAILGIEIKQRKSGAKTVVSNIESALGYCISFYASNN